MGRTLYLDCSSGISGDMVVGALLDLGADEKGLRAALGSLPASGYEVRVGRRSVSGIDVCDFDVVLDEEHDGHDHDMGYLYGHDHHDHGHDHDHGHHQHDNGHHHEHRGLADVLAVIDAGDLPPRTRETAERTFRILAEAEAKAHGTSVEEVHFHEVGAIDSIVDIVSVAWCLDDLDVTDAVVSPLAEGEGSVRCAHGVLPVPVPAVANIVAAHGLVLAPNHRRGEFVTPTGAAVAAAVRTRDALPEAYKVTAVGVGSGKRAYDPPSTVRAMLVEPVAKAVPAPSRDAEALGAPDLWKLECEVDDCTGEALGHCLERLYGAGVREAHYLPAYMKKNRPGYQLEVLVDESHVRVAERIIFEDTTTIGIRRGPLWRTALDRREVELETPYGTILGKEVVLPTGEVRRYPEYDSVSAVAKDRGASFQAVYRAAVAAAR